MESNELKDIVIIYHGNCRDGFGAAYAAWKKFGDGASYIPTVTQRIPPEGLIDKEIYILDYSYPKEILEELAKNNKSVVTIDHHLSAKGAVTSFPQNVFDMSHSGAYLAWQYFQPGTEVPLLLRYVEDHDIWKFEMDHTREFGAALGEYTMDFETWDTLNKNFSDKAWFDSFIRHGAVISGFEQRLIKNIVNFRERVEFEGHECYVVNAERIYRSAVGHELATLSESEGGAPMGIVYYRYEGGVHCSLRSNGEFDVAALATKHGGGGHKNAASIRVADFSKLPFRFL